MKIAFLKSRRRALTLIELCVVLAALVTLIGLAYIARADRRVNARAGRVICVNNLKQIGMAFDVWSGDHGQKFPMELSQTNGGTMEFMTGPNEWRHFQVMSNELRAPKVLLCPADALRPLAATNFVSLSNSNLSFFIALDFSRPTPQAIWAGDRNLTNGTPIEDGILELTTNRPAGWTAEMHKKAGNILLFDGSVLQASAAGLRNTIANSGSFTNRVQMPVLGP